MKNLTLKQLDAKFARAAKLAAELDKITEELYAGCDTYKYGFGNALGISARTGWLSSVFTRERDMHKPNKR